MSTPVYNIEGNRGGTVSVTVEVTESDGSVADLTGYTGEMQARASTDSTTVLMAGTVTVAPTTGLVTGTFSAADTAAATWLAAKYDMRISSGGVVEYLVKGTIKLEPTVTR